MPFSPPVSNVKRLIDFTYRAGRVNGTSYSSNTPLVDEGPDGVTVTPEDEYGGPNFVRFSSAACNGRGGSNAGCHVPLWQSFNSYFTTGFTYMAWFTCVQLTRLEALLSWNGPSPFRPWSGSRLFSSDSASSGAHVGDTLFQGGTGQVTGFVFRFVPDAPDSRTGVITMGFNETGLWSFPFTARDDASLSAWIGFFIDGGFSLRACEIGAVACYNTLTDDEIAQNLAYGDTFFGTDEFTQKSIAIISGNSVATSPLSDRLYSKLTDKRTGAILALQGSSWAGQNASGWWQKIAAACTRTDVLYNIILREDINSYGILRNGTVENYHQHCATQVMPLKNALDAKPNINYRIYVCNLINNKANNDADATFWPKLQQVRADRAAFVDGDGRKFFHYELPLTGPMAGQFWYSTAGYEGDGTHPETELAWADMSTGEADFVNTKTAEFVFPVIDTTKPTLSVVTIEQDSTTLTVTLNEADSLPILPANGVTGVALSSSSAVPLTVSNLIRQTDLTYSGTLSRPVYDYESVTLSSTGSNIADSAGNTLADVSGYAVGNLSGLMRPQVATPVIAPNSGTYEGEVEVSITCVTAGSAIYVKLGTGLFNLYTGPFALSTGTTVVEAYATQADYSQSVTASATFVVMEPTPPGTVAAPTFDPVAGTYNEAKMVSISTTTPDALIKFKIGSGAYSTYTGPVTVSQSQVLTAYATKFGMEDSAEVSAAYVINTSGTGGGGGVTEEQIDAIVERVTAAVITSQVARVPVAQPLRVTDTDGSPVGAANNGRYVITQGDTAPARQIQVIDSNSRPLDLTGATVLYKLKQHSGTVPDAGPKTVSAPATVVSAAGGLLSYDWANDGTDTDTPGLFHETWMITWANGDVTTVPGSGNIVVEVRAS